jgi:hypothetical protein
MNESRGCCPTLLERVLKSLAEMGCCNSKAPAGAALGPKGFLSQCGGECSAVGIMARELTAFDFASEVFALDYTRQVVTAGVGHVIAASGPDAAVPSKGRTHNVPLDHATIQDALDAACDGDVRAAPAASIFLHLLLVAAPAYVPLCACTVRLARTDEACGYRPPGGADSPGTLQGGDCHQ